MIEGFRIIDAHCHPIAISGDSLTNSYGSPVDAEGFMSEMKSAGLDFCCGSVIKIDYEPVSFDFVRKMNDDALELEKKYPDFYQAGIHIHPGFLKESLAELERCRNAGVTWVGELVYYLHGYKSYSSPEMMEIMAAARDMGMTVNIHPADDDDLIRLVKNFPDLQIIAAHPGERTDILRRVELLNAHKNLHWDISGTGLFRWGMLRHLVEKCGEEKLLFGTDFPICNIAMQIYGVLSEHISDIAKTAIFSGNFERLCGRKNG